MKTCKKCKKSVPNNLKICRYCGADVSKIKPNNKNKVNNSNNTKIKKESVSKKEIKKSLDKTEVLETKVIDLDKTEILETVVFDVEKLNEKVQEKEKKVESEKSKNRKKEKTKSTKNEENLVEKLEEDNQLSDFNVFNEKTKNKEKINSLTKAQQIYFVKKSLKRKRITKFIFAIVTLLLLGYLIYNVFTNIDDYGYVVNGNEDISAVTFNMGDIIIYEDIEYVITGVEKSSGTAYKKPKKDNIYLIVSLSLENKSDKKHKYSGTYFTMLNSKNEETNRIISPVNAGEDLYSGSLVVGGKKEASIVFEVPKDDKELFLQYYNGEELENYEKLLDEQEKLEEEIPVKNQEETNTEEKVDIEEIKKPNPKFRVKIKVD